MILYPAHDDSANIAVFKLPIKWYINLEYKKTLSIDFSRISNFLKLENSTILNLKNNFKVADNTHFKSRLKEKIIPLIKSGNYKTKAEIGKKIGISDSYVCRILKHAK